MGSLNIKGAVLLRWGSFGGAKIKSLNTILSKSNSNTFGIPTILKFQDNGGGRSSKKFRHQWWIQIGGYVPPSLPPFGFFCFFLQKHHVFY